MLRHSVHKALAAQPPYVGAAQPVGALTESGFVSAPTTLSSLPASGRCA